MATSSAKKNYAAPSSLKKYISANTLVVRSPGRINLIGEHTDYNQGFVLPAAIDKAAWLAITPRRGKLVQLYSIDMQDEYSVSVEALSASVKTTWPNYILGVVQQFKNAGKAINGFDAALTADVPIGAGLSSSAAVECAVAMGLNEMWTAGFDTLALVKMAQKAENEFVGVQCGIMDQFASMFGKSNHVIRLDCRSLEYIYEPFNMNGFKVVLFDSNVKHSLASSEYNVRRLQCEKGVSLIAQHHHEVKSLRDATMELLDKYVLPNDITVYQRCKYVVEENERLLKACRHLEENNMQAFGAKMFETHDGLSKLYEVSCSELDFLVSHVKGNPAVFGARMMGGGFGGCTINLVKDEAINELIETTSAAYKYTMGKELKAYIVNIDDGTSILK